MLNNNKADYNYILSLYKKQTDYILKELNYDPSKIYGYETFKSIIYKIIDDKNLLYLYDIEYLDYKCCFITFDKTDGISLYYINDIFQEENIKKIHLKDIGVSPLNIDEQITAIIIKIIKYFEDKVYPNLESYQKFKKDEKSRLVNEFLNRVKLEVKNNEKENS